MLQHPVPEKLLVHIGDIPVSFALVVSTISLYKERHGEDTDFGILRELMKRAADLEEKRNQSTHSV